MKQITKEKEEEQIKKELTEGTVTKTYCSPTLHYYMGACPNCTVGIRYNPNQE